jgi:hypothetical protein
MEEIVVTDFLICLLCEVRQEDIELEENPFDIHITIITSMRIAARCSIGCY